MKTILLLIFLVPLVVSAQDISLRIDTVAPAFSAPLRLDSSKIDFSGTGWKFFSLPDPCSDPARTFWPVVFREACKDNPMHCRHCGRELKKGESFCYVVMKVEGDSKYADWIHIRCAIKRIR